ncbi:hypothetical protein [Sellimonas intestinalis]|uniref:hypothetical protein n=1 Tax=Sellimonas intestinalis TaxID=1653434 RepID=UPI003993506C
MKKRRNRLISIALSIGLCAGLAACSGNSGSSDSGKKRGWKDRSYNLDQRADGSTGDSSG